MFGGHLAPIRKEEKKGENRGRILFEWMLKFAGIFAGTSSFPRVPGA